MKQINVPYSRFMALICLVFILASCSQKTKKQFHTVQEGQFEASITQNGELQAVKARPIVIPYIGWRYGHQYKIIGLLEHGTKVSKGDSIARLDPSSVMKYLIQNESNLEIQQAELTQLIAREDIRINNLQSQLDGVELQYEQKKLEVDKYKFESVNKKKIKELELQQARIRLDKIQKKIESSIIIRWNNIKIQQIRIDKIRNSIGQTNKALKKLTIRSPIDGILQLKRNYRTDQLVKIGDELYQGLDFASVPNLSSMKVKSFVHETDFNKVYVGQKALVKLDAYKEKSFSATISKIARLSHQKSRDSDIKVFDIEMIIDEKDVVLKPGMTVSCKIIYADLEQAKYVSSNSIKKEDDQYFVFRKMDEKLIRQPVRIGPANADHTVIYGDVQKGDKVISIDSYNKGAEI